MKISYEWLKDYIDYLPSPLETADILTSIGLEVESIENFSNVKGGLKGVVVGEVVSCEKHPDADKLSLTKVDIGTGELVSIVCGAPNIKKEQKVPVATIGAVIYKGNESFTIGKTKIRGQVSEGMICAEDELGLGDDHNGIMVLNPDAKPGMPASEYFQIYTDTVFEIGITPNRIDGASHYGVVRDLAAFLGKERTVHLKRVSIENFKKDNDDLPIEIEISDKEGCKRYAGISLTGVEIKNSPLWMQNRLRAIGLKPINNVVDITNYVLHETGQPLHSFDADKIKGRKIIVKTLLENTSLICLDEQERKLSEEDLIVCNEEAGMAIAGVFGGLDSGVTEKTKNVFLESAWFNPVYIRRTSRRHMLYTDSSFRFERGADPNITLYALIRAALMMKDMAGGKISSDIIDVYPEPVLNKNLFLSFRYLYRLTGSELETPMLLRILSSLDIKILGQYAEGLQLEIPAYRVDVTRPADVVEEILRIYGFNNIPVSENLSASLSYQQKPDKDKILNIVSDLLSSNGFNEIMSNSLTKASYYDAENEDASLVRIYNPLSSDLNGMRKKLLFGGLEAIAYNTNRQNPDLRLFEFGNIYYKNPDEVSENLLGKYKEEERLALFITGEIREQGWTESAKMSDFFHMKAYVELILKRLGFIPSKLNTKYAETDHINEAYAYSASGTTLAIMGKVSDKLIKHFDIKNEVFYAELFWGNILSAVGSHITQFSGLPKYPEVRRDLSMIIENSVTFENIRKATAKVNSDLIRKINLFDVYEDSNIGKGKKSYAVSFILRDDSKTLTDKEIDNIMGKISKILEKELGAQIRS